ncbi:MAG TPA: class D sortase [Myxococcaceae bacterium]|nr:class D sortase [Myxococcaceae bacterium]
MGAFLDESVDRRSPWLRRLRLIERVAWVMALVLGGTWATVRGLAWAAERRSIAAFHEIARAAVASPRTGAGAPVVEVDQSLWDAGRIRAYARALARPAPPPLALLRIPRLGLEVPVLQGTDEWTLDRAVGHIEGTSRPGQAGNVGIAGHRDGFFRVLKDVTEGDVVELALPGEVRRFRVERLSIVGPDDAQVLAPTPAARLTLVTCYPFYFVGSAPRRFIVQAAPE